MENQFPGWREDTPHLFEHHLRCLEVLENHVRRHYVEAIIAKRQVLSNGGDRPLQKRVFDNSRIGVDTDEQRGPGNHFLLLGERRGKIRHDLSSASDIEPTVAVSNIRLQDLKITFLRMLADQANRFREPRYLCHSRR